MDLEPSARGLWNQMCLEHGDKTASRSGYYSSPEQTDSIDVDFELCQKDALAGNERAQRYMAKFVELRMKA